MKKLKLKFYFTALQLFFTDRLKGILLRAWNFKNIFQLSIKKNAKYFKEQMISKQQL